MNWGIGHGTQWEGFMQDLKAMFQQCFGIPLLPSMLPDNELLPLLQGEGGLLYGSRQASQEQYVLQGHIAGFIESAPEGYFLIGFYGHGINSYAFYYSRVDAWSKVLFRLPYGGAYMDNDKMAASVVQFLTRYFEFEQGLRGMAEHLVAIESMGEGEYRITLKNQRLVEFRESLFDNPDFYEKMGEQIRSRS
jgi:hypothetical protein